MYAQHCYLFCNLKGVAKRFVGVVEKLKGRIWWNSKMFIWFVNSNVDIVNF